MSNNVSRRALLTAVAISPFLSEALTLDGTEQKIGASRATKLQVYLHGAFIVDLRKGGAAIYAPQVMSGPALAHEYRAGYGRCGEGELVEQNTALGMNGFGGAPSAAYSNIQVPVVGKDTIFTHAGIYFGAALPMPSRIVAVRSIQKCATKKHFFPNAAVLHSLETLPLLLRLEYDLQNGDRPNLTGGNWTGSGNTPGANPLCIHFRAEPANTAVVADHDAVELIGKLLNLDLSIDPCYQHSVMIPPANIQDEGGLTELPCTRREGPGEETPREAMMMFGTHPANCASVVIGTK
jgi:hypothetical protein